MKNIFELKNKIKEIKKGKFNLINKPIILIDQDDVLAELVLYVLDKYNIKHNTNYSISDVTDWNIGSIINENIYEIMFDPKIYLKLEEVPLMKDCLKLLLNHLPLTLY